MKKKVVCVFNNKEIFDKVILDNENLKDCEKFPYDNTIENVSITKHYNNFINENVFSCNDDFWCLFLHQDFGVMEDVDAILKKMDKNSIYGAIGVKTFKGLFWGKKGGGKLGFKRHLTLAFGRILQGNNNFDFKEYGIRVFFQPIVKSVDCCCIMIHSSLIRKYNLQFDENLNFHMYAEELCYRTKKDYKIKTKVIQMNCFHLGRGTFDEEFKKSLEYLKNKFKIKKIPSTCYN